MGKTLFISDLDGTLLNSEARVSDASVSMLNEAISYGASVSVATARTPSTVSFLLKDINFTLPLVLMTGSAVWDIRTRRYLSHKVFDRETARKVVQTVISHDLPAFIYRIENDIIHITHNGPLSKEEKNFVDERLNSPFKRFHLRNDGVPVLPDDLNDMILVYSMQPGTEGMLCYDEICKIGDCNPIFYHDIYGVDNGILEVFSKDATKAKAMEWLKRHSGAERVVAFGDNINDIPMLRAADVAVVVDNAVDEVKEIADVVIGDNNDDSVARFILEST